MEWNSVFRKEGWTMDIDGFITDEMHEECGVLGVYDTEGNDVVSNIYYGLFALQHRGQESCGIAVSDTNGPKGKVMSCKGMGLISEVCTEENMENLKGNIGVGHVRYSRTGENSIHNTQPLVLNYLKGTLCIAHNGSIINTVELREELEYTGAIFQTSIDTEVIAYHIARERLTSKTVEEAVTKAVKKLVGAYSLVIMSPRKLIGARDPFGFHPLCIGKKGSSYILASESAALSAVDAEFIRDVLPGEVVMINDGGIHSDISLCTNNHARCVFEYIYFARPDSHIDGISVYNSRIMAGRILAQTHSVDADIVVGVPDSGNAAALGYALESGIPFGMAFVKNSYVGRTFIKPKQAIRASGVRIKLNVLPEVVEGKRVVMIDDSIVRGTTTIKIVKMLKKAGATEVHVRISSSPFLYPCYYGVDVPTGDQLIARNNSIDQIREMIGADSLGYLALDRIGDLIGKDMGYCDACFTGKYPTEIPKRESV